MSSDPRLWDNTLTFYINGVEYNVTNPDPSMHLVDYIRDVAMLKGTKVSLRERCGAHCTAAPLCAMDVEAAVMAQTVCPWCLNRIRCFPVNRVFLRMW